MIHITIVIWICHYFPCQSTMEIFCLGNHILKTTNSVDCRLWTQAYKVTFIWIETTPLLDTGTYCGMNCIKS